MKVYDKVKVTKIRKEYEDFQGTKYKIKKGDIGIIWSGEIREECFLVFFEFNKDSLNKYEYLTIPIQIQDLELVEDGNATDEAILNELPSKDKHWWCKVEDGYIKNLLGEIKNKIQYDYKS